MAETENKQFPGLPNYIGPREGFFALLHHAKLFEWSENVVERVDYVRANKSKIELDTRLRHMCYLPKEHFEEIYAALSQYEAVTQPAWSQYQAVAQPARSQYEAVTQQAWGKIASYLQDHITDFRWEKWRTEI